MAKAVVLWQVSHNFDPADTSKIQVFVTFRFLDAESYLGTLDATATLDASDTSATLSAKIQAAIIAKAALYGIILAGDDIISTVHGFARALTSTVNNTTITLADDGINQTLTGSVGYLTVAGYTAGVRLADHIAVAQATPSATFAMRVQENFSGAGYGFNSYVTTASSATVISIAAWAEVVAAGAATGDTSCVEMQNTVRGTGKALNEGIGAYAILRRNGTDATTAMNTWEGFRVFDSTGDPITLTNWIGYLADESTVGANRWACKGANKIESTKSDFIASGASKGFIGQYSDQAGRYFRLRANYNVGVPVLVIDDIGTTLPAT